MNCDKRDVCSYHVDTYEYNCLNIVRDYREFNNKLHELIAEYCLFYTEGK